MFLTDISELTYGSQKRVSIKCEFNNSQCKKIVETEYCKILKSHEKHDGKYR